MSVQNKVLFLDIDGPMIPGRAYMLANQTKPVVKTFDPVAVSLINEACRNRRNIVIHSSWIRTNFWNLDEEKMTVKEHCVRQGLDPAFFHTDWSCNPDISWRYDRVQEWLARHPEVTDYVVIDDESDPEGKVAGHLVLVDFEDGLLTRQFRQVRDGNWAR